MKTVFESWIDNIGAENGFIVAILGEGKNNTRAERGLIRNGIYTTANPVSTAKTNKPPSKEKGYEKKATKKKLYTE